ncbi:hypothetical protein AURDEDRAFT_129265 [Auricularia subglabra TFB-10046 SS5]|nr:hypothetical protein AURDEDRAFT_129265 [Auricularia subglabra TFB-10046 SS5]
MSEDILCVVAEFSDTPTLAAICRVSKATRRVAARLLYRSVFVRSLDELGLVHNALVRDAWLAPHVLELFYDSALDVLLSADDPGYMQWGQQFVTRLIKLVFGIIPRLTGLETLAIDCVAAIGGRRARFTKLLGKLPRLRNVRLPGLGSTNLRKLRMQRPLEHLALYERPQTGLEDLIVAHAATLHSLRVYDCGALFKRLADARQVVFFPLLHTLAITKEILPLSPNCATIFPALRSLSVSRVVRDVCNHWPRLEHLDYDMGYSAPPVGLLPRGHPVRSLRLTYTGTDLSVLPRFRAWESPHVCALALSWPCGGFVIHAAAIDAFLGMRMLDVTLFGDDSETDPAVWLRNVAAIAVVPPHWEVLTLRGATGLDALPADLLAVTRDWIPSLRLMRIFAKDDSQLLVFAHPQPVDWMTAVDPVDHSAQSSAENPPTTFDDLLAASVELAFQSTVLRLQKQVLNSKSDTNALTDAHAHVSDVVARTMALIMRRANSNAHFTMRLPPELFAGILGHLGVHDRFNAAGVCHRWRAVALAFPRVWVDLADFGLATPRLALALSRGRAVPVDLCLMVRSGESGRILPHLRNHLHRIRTLQISIAEVWHGELCESLAAPAPLLCELSIRVHGAHFLVGPRLRENIFAGCAPRLTILTLAHVTPSLMETPGLAEVESLRIVAQYAQPAECALFLSATPKLLNLELDLLSDAIPGPTVESAPPAPTLRSLYLVRCTGSLLGALPHASCGKVLVDHCDTSAIWALLHGLGTGTRLALLQNREREYSPFRTVVRATDDSGRERFARCWSHNSLEEIFTPHVTAHLVSLTTEAHLWHAPWTRVPLPRLEERGDGAFADVFYSAESRDAEVVGEPGCESPFFITWMGHWRD